MLKDHLKFFIIAIRVHETLKFKTSLPILFPEVKTNLLSRPIHSKQLCFT